MASYLLDWLQLLVRWFHMIIGVAWIGASFYFIWVDNKLRPLRERARGDKNVAIELWTIHAGAFHNTQQPRLEPGTLPSPLHWFKWEAYFTWISGFFLLCLIYYLNAAAYLIDPRVAEIDVRVAIAIGIGILAAGWILYDRLCKSRFGSDTRFLTSALGVMAVAASWGLCHVFSGRGAYIHFGALFGTIMAGNVFFLIIPAQKELVRARFELREPDPAYAEQAKRRSLHNTFFTFPVLFTMISSHYPMTYGSPYNWLVLLAMSFAGAAMRLYFVARQTQTQRWPPLIAAVATIIALIVALAPAANKDAATGSTDFAPVRSIVQARCVSCHSQTPTQPGFADAPKGVMLDTPERIVQQAIQIDQQVSSHVMPFANVTGMTEVERDTIARWYANGAMGK
ncbi:MAG: urate hydroxylase PuuD [Betaproteobacteria bacterium]